MKEPVFTEHMQVYNSEDGIDIVACWVVSQGKEYYLSVWEHPETIPKRIGHDVSETLDGVAMDVYEEKGGDIYNLIV